MIKNERGMIKNVYLSLCKLPVFLAIFLFVLNFVTKFSKKIF